MSWNILSTDPTLPFPTRNTVNARLIIPVFLNHEFTVGVANQTILENQSSKSSLERLCIDDGARTSAVGLETYKR